jgi:phosphohistidine phosphatase SixA
VPVEVLDSLYLAPPATIRDVAWSALESGAESVLLIAHNPGIGDVARSVAPDIVRGYPPGALTALVPGAERTLALDGFWAQPE